MVSSIRRLFKIGQIAPRLAVAAAGIGILCSLAPVPSVVWRMIPVVFLVILPIGINTQTWVLFLSNLLLMPFIRILLFLPSNSSIDKGISYLGGLAASMLLMILLFCSTSFRIRTRTAFSVYLAVLLGILYAAQVFPDLRRAPFTFGFVVVWSYGVISALYFLNFRDETRTSWRDRMLDVGINLPAFWLPYLCPVPGLLSRWLKKDGSLHQNFLSIQISGLKLIVWTVLPLVLFSHVFREIAAVNPLLYSIANSHAHSQNTALGEIENVLSLHELWLSAILGIIWVTLNFAIEFGFGVSIARLCGVPLLRGVYRPFEAKTFHEFFYRFNFYYGQMAIDLFIAPSLKVLNRKNLTLALVIGLTFGSAFYHLFRWPTQLLADPILFLTREVQIFYYSAAVGVLVGISHYFDHKIKFLERAFHKKILQRLVMLTCFLLFSAFAMAFRNYHVSDRREALIVLKQLFGLL